MEPWWPFRGESKEGEVRDPDLGKKVEKRFLLVLSLG